MFNINQQNKNSKHFSRIEWQISKDRLIRNI